MDAVIVKDFQNPFVSYSYRPCLATVEQNRAHYCLVDPALCTQLYFTPRECGTSKINPASDLLGVLAVCHEHRIEVLEFVNILQWLTMKQDHK